MASLEQGTPTLILSRRKLTLGALLLAGTPLLRAQDDYPSRAVKLIIPFAAGSSGDLLGRELAVELSGILGQPVVSENRVGAGANIGTAFGMRSPANGYTLTLIGQGAMVHNQFLYTDLGFDPDKDVAPIAKLVAVQSVLVVGSQSPFHTAQEALSAIRSSPQKYSYGSSGVGTSAHISGAQLENLAKVKMLHVPFQGVPQAMAAIIPGTVDFGFINIAAALSLLKAGRLRSLAVTRNVRSPNLPDVPTLDEAGVNGYNHASWIGIGAPAGTPQSVIQKVAAALDKAFAQAALRDKLAAVAFELFPTPFASPAEFTRSIQAETLTWGPVMKAIAAQRK